MQVTVELFSYFRTSRFHRDTLEFPVGATVVDLLIQLDISPSDVGVIVINGASGTVTQRLYTGDRVTFIPIIGGG